MEDNQIIFLYQQREESAISATRDKYGSYCAAIAGNILDNHEDVEEVLADTWLRVWDTIPPNHPANLKLYLARIVRNLAYDRFRMNTRKKRGGSETDLVLEELSQCIAAPDRAEDRFLRSELQQVMQTFLDDLPARDRNIFLRRYFYVEDIPQIAQRYFLTQAGVRTVLSRCRRKLRSYLIEGGFTL